MNAVAHWFLVGWLCFLFLFVWTLWRFPEMIDTRGTWRLTYTSGRYVLVMADDEAEARDAARLYRKNFEQLATVEKETT